ncbi:transporter [Winogradskyella undariae]|uniref:transporter n=1 Tax=Winogradskyella TaxID=286104 RepID=UPI00156BB00A|nr:MULTISPECIES: transporter [Winogradskyella]NRR92865.1 transporter [Winogradskyella undariae]QXP79174.1 transporter [Winogradskyella sp. HaHa_3_26]
MYNKIVLPFIGIILLCSNVGVAQEDQWTSARPDGHAPISVMGDHYHKKGEFMLSYRYMPMWMDGNFQSSNDISNEDIYEDYMIAPQKMSMDMHMLGVMYAPSDQITLMVMGSYITNSMDLKTGAGVDFLTESGGLGDLTVSSLIKIMNRNRQSLHGNVGVSIPTGDIDQRDATPMADNAQLAYPMQLGSGTWDPSLGLTYLGQSDKFSWGAQSIYKVRIGENSENYTLGNRFDVVGWGAIKLSESFSLSTSLSYYDTQKIDGVDADLNPLMMPLFNTVNSGRSQIDVGLGTNFLIPKGSFKNLRLAAEVKIPTFQEVNGIQMKNTLMATFGVQYVIGHKE